MVAENDKVLGGWLIVRGLNAARMVRADQGRFFLARQWRSGKIEVSRAEFDYDPELAIFTISATRILKKSAEALFGAEQEELLQEFPSNGILSLKNGYPIFLPWSTRGLRLVKDGDHSVVFAEDVPVFRVHDSQLEGLKFTRRLSEDGVPAKKGFVIASAAEDCDVEYGSGDAMVSAEQQVDSILLPQTSRAFDKFRILAAMPVDLDLANKDFVLPPLAKHRLLRAMMAGELNIVAPSRCTVMEIDATSITIQEQHSHGKQKIRLPATAVPLVQVGEEVHGTRPLAHFVNPDDVVGETFESLSGMLGKHIYSVIGEFLRMSGEADFQVVPFGTRLVDARNLSPDALEQARPLGDRPEVWIDVGSGAVELAPDTAYLHLDSIEWPCKMITDEIIQIDFQVLPDAGDGAWRERDAELAAQ